MIGQNAIFLPMGALALLTFGVLGLVPFRRFQAVSRKQVTAKDFRFGESGQVPGLVSLPNRNYMNLLELPTLFYAACLMFHAAQRVDRVALGLAWGFVAVRLVHSVIHLTYNNVLHRLVAFAVGNTLLGALWVIFFTGD